MPLPRERLALAGALAACASLGLYSLVVAEGEAVDTPSHVRPIDTHAPAEPAGSAWAARARPRCNPVEVNAFMRRDPPPTTVTGRKAAATCYALAGDVDRARAELLELPAEERWKGAGMVFDAVHPAADAGDDTAAGPAMELVIEFWPNHYMALYHAGAAAFARGEPGAARGYLERFLSAYDRTGGWTSDARRMLAAIEG